MDCPRCGEALTRYTIGGDDERRTVACEHCGYLGVTVEHESEPVAVESWQDAVRRFYDENGD